MSVTRPGSVWLVTAQEFRIRLRTGKWRWLLVGWVVLLAVFTGLLDATLETGYSYSDSGPSRRGIALFGILMLFVLGMVLLISPALTSQTINGDRERGTLATLQVTLLRPSEIALGKLLAGWGVGLVMLVFTLPFYGYAVFRGGLQLGRAAALYAVVALLIGVVCAVSQAFSAMLARSITSALLSYLFVGALTVGTLIAFTLIVPLVRETVTYQQPDGTSYQSMTSGTDRVWWILAPNPFVVLADSAPRAPVRYVTIDDQTFADDYDPLSELGREIRDLRQPSGPGYNGESNPPPVWPWGLGFDVLLGVAAVWITTRRLTTPSRRLTKGVRIA